MERREEGEFASANLGQKVDLTFDVKPSHAPIPSTTPDLLPPHRVFIPNRLAYPSLMPLEHDLGPDPEPVGRDALLLHDALVHLTPLGGLVAHLQGRRDRRVVRGREGGEGEEGDGRVPGRRKEIRGGGGGGGRGSNRGDGRGVVVQRHERFARERVGGKGGGGEGGEGVDSGDAVHASRCEEVLFFWRGGGGERGKPRNGRDAAGVRASKDGGEEGLGRGEEAEAGVVAAGEEDAVVESRKRRHVEKVGNLEWFIWERSESE
jgi:hypothetical protein